MSDRPAVFTKHAITKDHMRSLANSNDHVFYLDSCGVKDALNLGKYEVILGLGVGKSYEIPVNLWPDWDEVDAMSNGDAWCFFVMGYDIKNAIHGLTSSNSDSLEWPNLSMIQPESVVALTKDNQLHIWADEPKALMEQLSHNQMETHAAESAFTHIRPSMTKESYVEKVEYIREEISAGNVYEMNLCMQYVMHDFSVNNAFLLYEKLITHSPTPFSAFVRHSSRHIMCASPERFLTKSDNHLYCQPIKGTSSRHPNVDDDTLSRDYLFTSEKERAEHVMIVDLVRNDLSRNSIPGTTTVEELFGVYSFAQVHHMISTIRSELKPDIRWSEIMKNTFPMGSMTGAPKYVAMQYIEALETNARGWYSGSLGYIEPGGNFDSNVIIRSLLYDKENKVASFSVGGAITFDSNPESEFQECQLKASAIRKVFGI